MENRVIIAGSRTVPEQDDELLIKLRGLTLNIEEDMEIVSGTAKGADTLGEWYAETMRIPVRQFPADWDTYGKRAGYLRNKQIADYATHLIAIVDLSVESKGTRHMIQLAKDQGLKIRVIYINENKAKYPKISLEK